jgi:hypothetical protein
MRGDVMKLQEENKNLKEKVINIIQIISKDQWNHNHALPENGGEYQPSKETRVCPTSTGRFPLSNDVIIKLGR